MWFEKLYFSFFSVPLLLSLDLSRFIFFVVDSFSLECEFIAFTKTAKQNSIEKEESGIQSSCFLFLFHLSQKHRKLYRCMCNVTTMAVKQRRSGATKNILNVSFVYSSAHLRSHRKQFFDWPWMLCFTSDFANSKHDFRWKHFAAVVVVFIAWRSPCLHNSYAEWTMKNDVK